MTNEIVFDPGLGFPPFSVVGDELQEPRGRTIKLGPSLRGQPKENHEREEDSEVTQVGTLNSGVLANESNGLSCFDEILLPRIVSSY